MFSVFGVLLLLATLAAIAYQLAFAGRPEGSHSWTGTAVKTLSVALLALAGLAGLAPGLILLGAGIGLARAFRRRPLASPPLSREERAALEALLRTRGRPSPGKSDAGLPRGNATGEEDP